MDDGSIGGKIGGANTPDMPSRAKEEIPSRRVIVDREFRPAS